MPWRHSPFWYSAVQPSLTQPKHGAGGTDTHGIVYIRIPAGGITIDTGAPAMVIAIGATPTAMALPTARDITPAGAINLFSRYAVHAADTGELPGFSSGHLQQVLEESGGAPPERQAAANGAVTQMKKRGELRRYKFG